MTALGVILARAGSKGLPDKCVRNLLDRPVIAYTFAHAVDAKQLTAIVLTTDSETAKALARRAGIEVVDRPAELATDTATVDAAARHAVTVWETKHGLAVDVIALLYGNIPVRTAGLTDRAIRQLITTGADSVRSVAPVSKQHPDWIHRLDGDRMIQFRPNSTYRRQDLEPLYYHDGAIAVVTRAALFDALQSPDDHQAFLGKDRRAIVQQPEESVDLDGPIDFLLAQAILRDQLPAEPASVIAPRIGLGESCGDGFWKAQCKHCSTNTGRAIDRRQTFVELWAESDARHVMVVAEAGVNHNGNVAAALQLVDVAADCGADAVKFQMFRAADLATAAAPTAGYQRRHAASQHQLDMLARLELSQSEFERIRGHCRDRSIAFLATPFSIDDVQRLLALEPAAIKIASTDLTNRPLLAAAAETGLTVIVSTGAATDEEIRASVADLQNLIDERRLVLLHCVSCYPTPDDAINLRGIATLAQTFGVPCGLSDHTLSTSMGGWAVAAGACLLEKHFTIDPSEEGPDHAMSLNPEQLVAYVSGVRAAERALGDGHLGLDDLENDVRRVARRSMVAAQSLPVGTTLTAEMIAFKRPGTGLAPARLDEVIGRRTRVAIARDSILALDMLE